VGISQISPTSSPIRSLRETKVNLSAVFVLRISYSCRTSNGNYHGRGGRHQALSSITNLGMTADVGFAPLRSYPADATRIPIPVGHHEGVLWCGLKTGGHSSPHFQQRAPNPAIST
jgi:hypothetical protein